MLLPELKKKKKTTHLFRYGLCGKSCHADTKVVGGKRRAKEATNHAKVLPMEGTKVKKGRKLQNGNGAAGPIGASESRCFFHGKKTAPKTQITV